MAPEVGVTVHPDAVEVVVDTDEVVNDAGKEVADDTDEAVVERLMQVAACAPATREATSAS